MRARLHPVLKNIVQDYSHRLLPRPTDKLAALTGLAGCILTLSHGSVGQYHAGLWDSAFRSQLAWEVAIGSKSRRLQNNLPTWSWASIQGPIRFPRQYGAKLLSHLQAIKVVCVPVHHDNPLGPIEANAYLELSVPPVPVQFLASYHAKWEWTTRTRFSVRKSSFDNFERVVDVVVDVEDEVLPQFQGLSPRECEKEVGAPCFKTRCSCRCLVSEMYYVCCLLYTELPDVDLGGLNHVHKTHAPIRDSYANTTFLLLESLLQGNTYRRVGLELGPVWKTTRLDRKGSCGIGR